MQCSAVQWQAPKLLMSISCMGEEREGAGRGGKVRTGDRVGSAVSDGGQGDEAGF